MNSFDTLILPDTEIVSERRYPLLLFFTPLHFLQLLEPEPEVDHESELFLQSGLCQPHLPAPLGDDLQQFLRLRNELRTRKEHYVAQLKDKSAEQKHGIVSSLLRDYGIRHRNGASELELWQARLVLAIAEMEDAEEDILREQLAEQFNEEDIAALRSLQGAAGIHEEEIINQVEEIRKQLQQPHTRDAATRFEAWLYLLKQQPLPPTKAWLASTHESAEAIFQRYESISHASAIPILKLAFPAQIAASGRYVVQEIEQFQQATASIHQGLTEDFERVVKTVPYNPDALDSLLPFGTDWAEQWEAMLDVYFPVTSYGRNTVTFYILAAQPIPRMLSLSESAGGSSSAHGLLGVLG